jgi:F-type H+-transporting ATPase subunit a
MIQEHAQEAVNVGEIVLHHTADASEIEFDFIFRTFTVHLPHWNDIHLGPITLNLSPTKHVVFMVLAAVLVFVSMWVTGKKLKAQSAGAKAPTGFANAMEAFVLFVRDDIAIAGVGKEMGAKYAPFIMSLFFFILYSNLLGLVPYGSSPTGNLAITGALAILSFIAIEIGGLMKLGMGGYMRTIFPKVPGMTGAPAMAMSVAMAPIEILGKLVKPFALAVRLFGNMTAGHFVILSLFGIIFLFGHLQIWNWAIGITTAGLVTLIMMLELFIAFLQAYVFALLTATFIGLMQHEH